MEKTSINFSHQNIPFSRRKYKHKKCDWDVNENVLSLVLKNNFKLSIEKKNKSLDFAREGKIKQKQV